MEARSRGHHRLLTTTNARNQPASHQPKPSANMIFRQHADQPNCQPANRQAKQLTDRTSVVMQA
eukprot:3686702-Pyramimonas_sp.AAC.1